MILRKDIFNAFKHEKKKTLLSGAESTTLLSAQSMIKLYKIVMRLLMSIRHGAGRYDDIYCGDVYNFRYVNIHSLHNTIDSFAVDFVRLYALHSIFSF